MKTIELDDETAETLKQLADYEHISLEQLLKKITQVYKNKQPELLTDFAGVLKDSPSFKDNPLDIQQAMRDEWR